ncbi:sodium-independent sulfate anion transporter [Thecamonas trahens ATCC 50062]|uniref:Sodium-independent sulfate anion transporter n=1 Tax=Thecamonas trahens ATCC 50062 TaxID=461836 RepID=A0A0L0DC51_THETB|nr:sodium-independent sulfate anion transporter [Thecamonas trahens ATCC 50062]KNC49815.1 sodium-independent sulfate anion transporter [Thecamonas trahens ATCC 50062]|eukprot:XP_013757597.1 sodium-independent sulfate anion transporter [Thecamonas trahens ATCC 50062]
MVVPQALAYASIATLPVEYGLLSAWVAPLVYAVLGTSRDIAVGPTAIMSLMVAHAVASMEAPADKVAAAAVLSFLAGATQILASLVRAGGLVSFLSAPVIDGFVSSAAVTIGFGQLHHFFGSSGSSVSFYDDVVRTFEHWGINVRDHWPDLLLGMGGVAVVVALKAARDAWGSSSRLCRALGTARNAIAVLGSTAFVVGYQAACGHSLDCRASCASSPFALTGHVPSVFASSFTVPSLGSLPRIGAAIGPYVPLAAAVGFLESISIAKAFGASRGYNVGPSQELFALGMANVLGSFASAFVVTGSFSRSAVQSRSGARSPLAGIMSSVIVLLAINLLTTLFCFVPKVSLAAIIITAVVPMFEASHWVFLWRTSPAETAVAGCTFVACLGLGIAYGIAIGLGASIVALLYLNSHPRIEVSFVEDATVLHLAGPLLFPAVPRLEAAAMGLLTDPLPPVAVILDLAAMPSLDASGIRLLERIVAAYRVADVPIMAAGVGERPLATLHASAADLHTLLAHASADVDNVFSAIRAMPFTLVRRRLPRRPPSPSDSLLPRFSLQAPSGTHPRG